MHDVQVAADQPGDPRPLHLDRNILAGEQAGAPDMVLTAVNTEQVITHVGDGRADIGFTEGPRRPSRLRGR